MTSSNNTHPPSTQDAATLDVATSKMNDNILNNLSTAILILDHELKLCFINQAAESLLEISSRRSIGHPIVELIPAAAAIESILLDAIRTNQRYTQRKAQLHLISGTDLTVDFTISPSSEDQWPRLIVEFQPQDRYLRIDRDAALQEHQEVTRLMIRSLAHEIKNPLGGIRGSAQLLQSELADPELHEYTNIIIEESDRLTSLVDRLLGPRTLPSFKSANIHEILERIRKLTELDANSNLEIIRDYDPSIPEICIDAEMMQQAILNIVRNAMQGLDHTPEPQIRIVTRTERQFTIASVRHRNVLRIDITDNGPGIPETLKEHLFYPMISGRPNGTGLGLSVAHSIVHQHQGIIEFESIPGETTFTIIIPLERIE
jgi:two-component system, NtrC family, nitrogen regulation sensor histidine kinase GlnL